MLLAVAVQVHSAQACPASVRKKILRFNKKAMEDYDLLEFESAKQTLLDAKSMARRKGCDDHSVAAKTYVNLAVLYIQGFKDEDRGKLMFRKALGISKHVKLDRQVATPKLLRIFNSVKKTLGVRVTRPVRPPPDVRRPPRPPRPVEPEKPARGLEHSPLEEAPRSTALEVKARVGNDMKASKVLLFYKVVGQNSFQAIPMKKVTEWTWKTTVPAGDVRGRSFYYYIEIRHQGKPQAASGNAASPHIIMLTKPTARDTGPVENPLDRGKGNNPTIKKKGEPVAGFSRVFLALSGNVNVGYVGKWKGDLSNVEPRTPGFALGTYGGLVEGGYFITPAMLISIAFQLGYASSDLSERAVIGWQGLVRFRYVALGAAPKSIFKFYVGAQIGGGDIYHMLELDGRQDTFRSGPGLIIGALVGFWVGTETVAGFLEIDPKGVIDFTKDVATVEVSGATIEVQHSQQHTFALGIVAGVAFRFGRF